MKTTCFCFALMAMANAVGVQSSVCRQEGSIRCDGKYEKHLQGVATDGKSLYWSFTSKIVRTDRSGKILAIRDAPSHQGDLCLKDGVVYVAVNRGRFNQEDAAVSQVHSYDAKTLKPLKIWALEEMPHGAGGMTSRGDRFFVVGGLPATHECNYVYEYTRDFALVKRHELKTGFTLMGIQTAAFEDGKFFFGIYGGRGNPPGVLKVSSDFADCERYTGLGAVGILKLDGRFFTANAFVEGAPTVQLGEILPDDGFCDASRRYVPEKNGGELRVFFAERDAGRYVDCGYSLTPDGYRPLTQCREAFLKVAMAARTAKMPVVCIDARHAYSVPDLVRGVRRAAEQDESLAVCFQGRPETVLADSKLSGVLAAITGEAERLGVKVVR